MRYYQGDTCRCRSVPTILCIFLFVANSTSPYTGTHNNNTTNIFAAAVATAAKANSECFSPWSTRSFGATTGGFHGSKGGGGGGGGNKRSPLSASQDLHSAAGMRTRVLPLPPWRGGEGGSELDGTLKNDERGRNPSGDDDLENIFDDHNDNNLGERNGNGGHATTPRRASEIGQQVVGNSTENDSSGYKSRRSRSSSENKGVDGDRDGQAAQDNGLKKSGTPAQQYGISSAAHLQRNSTRRGSLKDGGREGFVLTDGSSDDELSCSSPAQSKGGGLMTRKGSRLRNENPTLSSEQAGDTSSPTPTDAGVPDRKRHSSGPTPAERSVEEHDEITRSEKRVVFSEGPAGGGRQASSTQQYSRPENQSAEGRVGSGASACRRHSSLEGRQNDDEAAGRSSEDQVAIREQEGLSTDNEPSPSRRPSILATHQTTAATISFPQGDHKDTVLAPPDRVDEAGVSTGVHGGLDICLHTIKTKETETHGGTQEEEYACVAAPEMDVGGTPPINVSVSAPTTAASRGGVAQLESGVVVKERQLGGEIDVSPAAREHRQPVGDGGKLQLASTSSSLDQDGHGPSTGAMTFTYSAKRSGEETKLSSAAAPAGAAASTTDVGPQSAVGAGSSAGGSVKGRGSTQDLPVSNNICDAPQSGATMTLMQEMLACTTQDNISNGEDTAIDNNPNVFTHKSEAVIRSPLEVITEVQSGKSSGDSFNDDARGDAALAAPSTAAVSTLDSETYGGAMRKPYCLSPTNVMRQARVSGTTAGAGSSCKERERLAARIQLSAGANAAGAAAAVTGVNTGPQGVASGPLPLNSSTTGSCFDGGFTPDRGGREEGGWTSDNGSPASCGNADSTCWRSAGKMRGSPEREEHGGGRLDGSGAPIENDRCPSSSPSSRFCLPSSETKTAPLYSAGGSTSLYEGSAIAANKSAASVRGGEGAWCFSRDGPEAAIKGGGRGYPETMGMTAGDETKKGCSLPRLDEEQLAVSLWVTLERYMDGGKQHLECQSKFMQPLRMNDNYPAYRLP